MAEHKMLSIGSVAYDEIDNKLQGFMTRKGYEVVSRMSMQAQGTFTYHVERDGMPFWVKIGCSESEEGCKPVENNVEEFVDSIGRIDALKNEVAALTALWKSYPSGETDSFQFPPGAEDVFGGEVDGLRIYGYARFFVEGNVLGKALKDKTHRFSEWIDPCVKIAKTLDSLPELHVPKTKQDKTVDFPGRIIEKATGSLESLKVQMQNNSRNLTHQLIDRAERVVQETRDFVASNKFVMGTAHGDFQPDHIVYLEGGTLPTLVQFSKLSQWNPRYLDIATMYAWVTVVLGDNEGGKNFWTHVSEKYSLSKEEFDSLRVMTNVLTLRMMSSNLGASGGGVAGRAVGVEVFVESD